MKKVQVHNKSARIKHVQTGGGKVVSIAPTEAPISLDFESDEEAKRFTDALKNPAVKRWVDAGELVIGGQAQASAPAGGQSQDSGPTPPAAPSAAAPPGTHPLLSGSKSDQEQEPEPPPRTRRG